jgi:hypothetical protein
LFILPRDCLHKSPPWRCCLQPAPATWGEGGGAAAEYQPLVKFVQTAELLVYVSQENYSMYKQQLVEMITAELVYSISIGGQL